MVTKGVGGEFDSRRLHFFVFLEVFQILKYEMSVLLKPLDLVVSVMAAVLREPNWTHAAMAQHLGMNGSQVFRAVRDAAVLGLLVTEPSGGRTIYHANRAALAEFLLHGVKYYAVPARGRLTRGVPTSHGAPVLSTRLRADDEPVPVWPHAEGRARGESFEPLHPCVPGAALRNERFYAAMALVDAIRGGRARERGIAAKLLPEILHAPAD